MMLSQVFSASVSSSHLSGKLFVSRTINIFMVIGPKTSLLGSILENSPGLRFMHRDAQCGSHYNDRKNGKSLRVQ